MGPGKQDKYVQWCHGAPGFLYMYCEAYRVGTITFRLIQIFKTLTILDIW